MEYNGILNVYKTQNISSNHVVISIKKILNIKKVGHTGTLDPLACGVLPICIGNATKVSEYLLSNDKTYSVGVKFGILTDTYDLEGTVLEEDENFKADPSKVLEVLESFVCEYDQIPPKYSALKINGNRAYDLARKGVDFQLESRKVKIYSITDIKINENTCFFTVKCSKGTYIRSLCYDIGKKLGTYGTMIFLERVSSGFFSKDTSVNFDDLNEETIKNNIISVDEVIPIPKLKIDEPEILRLLLNGVVVRNPKYVNKITQGVYFLYDHNKLKGICKRESDYLKLIKFLN